MALHAGAVRVQAGVELWSSESRLEPFTEAPATGADGGVLGLAFGVRVIPFGSRLSC